MGLRKWLKGHPLEMALEHLEGRETQTITGRSCLGFQEDAVTSKCKWICAAASWLGGVWGICLKPAMQLF